MRLTILLLTSMMTCPSFATTRAELDDRVGEVQAELTEQLTAEFSAINVDVDGRAIVLTSTDEATRSALVARYPAGSRVEGIRVVVIASAADALGRLQRELDKLEINVVTSVGGARTLVLARSEADRRRALARLGRRYFGLNLNHDILIGSVSPNAASVRDLLAEALRDHAGVTAFGVEAVDHVERVVIAAADEAARADLRRTYAEGNIQGVPIEIETRGRAKFQNLWERCQTWLGDLQSKVGGV